MPFEATRTGLKIIILSHMISLIYGICKKNDSNELILKKRNRLKDIENKLIVTKGEKGGGIN